MAFLRRWPDAGRGEACQGSSLSREAAHKGRKAVMLGLNAHRPRHTHSCLHVIAISKFALHPLHLLLYLKLQALATGPLEKLRTAKYCLPSSTAIYNLSFHSPYTLAYNLEALTPLPKGEETHLPGRLGGQPCAGHCKVVRAGKALSREHGPWRKHLTHLRPSAPGQGLPE